MDRKSLMYCNGSRTWPLMRLVKVGLSSPNNRHSRDNEEILISIIQVYLSTTLVRLKISIMSLQSSSEISCKLACSQLIFEVDDDDKRLVAVSIRISRHRGFCYILRQSKQPRILFINLQSIFHPQRRKSDGKTGVLQLMPLPNPCLRSE